MRKSKKTTFQWPKVSKLLTTLPRHRADIRTGLRFSFWAPEVTVLRVRKSHFHCFSSLQKRPFRCPKRKSETRSDIRSVTWLRGKKFAHFRPLKSGFLAFSHFIQGFFSFYVPHVLPISQEENGPIMIPKSVLK